MLLSYIYNKVHARAFSLLLMLATALSAAAQQGRLKEPLKPVTDITRTVALTKADTLRTAVADSIVAKADTIAAAVPMPTVIGLKGDSLILVAADTLLQEVLPVILHGLELLNIELKNDHNIYPGIEKHLLTFLQGYPQLTSKILFSSFDYESLVRLRALAPQARIGLLTRQFDVQQALKLGAESVHINHIRFTPGIAQSCRENHLKLYCYTVNEGPLAKRLADQGVDGIFTDDITIFQP